MAVHRFTLSIRDVEYLLAERSVTVFYEAVRLWCCKFGPTFAHNLHRRQGRLGDVWHVDEVFIRIPGERRYLWRAVPYASVGLGNVTVPRGLGQQRISCILYPCRGPTGMRSRYSRCLPTGQVRRCASTRDP